MTSKKKMKMINKTTIKWKNKTFILKEEEELLLRKLKELCKRINSFNKMLSKSKRKSILDLRSK